MLPGMAELHLVDPTTNIHLQGNFAPIHREVTEHDLAVEGALPTDLTGVYLRNGPNPRFTPLGSYTYPMEGDAMLHGVWLEGGRARYRNRWVRTKGMEADERAGRDIFGGLMTPAFVDTALLGPDPDPGWPFRLDPFINVVHHGGRYLALAEGLPPYEVTRDLDTVGLYQFDGELPAGMCAHPKVDPITGDMVLFRYDVQAPFLSWAVVGSDGSVVRPETAVEGVDQGFMIHDFAITEHHVVLVVAPVMFDLDAMTTGGDVLAWKPELGTRIAVIPRTGDGPTRWIHSDAFFVWHFANAYEDGDDIVLDFPWWSSFSLHDDPTRTGAFVHARLNPDRGTCELHRLAELATEFPRIDDRFTGRPNRYLTVSHKGAGSPLAVGAFDELVRVDTQAGTYVTQPIGLTVGEVVFAPRDGSTDELDGCYLSFASSADARHSWLLVWDAAAFPGEPVARVAIPQRVPNGLHGNWIPAPL
jgi:carotenoid cleavage dioxygenase-like enzyme